MGRDGLSQNGADIMNVRIVSANIRYSAEAKGAWRTIEVGAEATVDPGENWHTAQQELYHQLGRQMKTLWANGNGTGKPQSSPEKPLPTAAPPSRPERWCETHNCDFKRYEKNGKSWWSHKVGNSWHRES
jgi:hypothetical protein